MMKRVLTFIFTLVFFVFEVVSPVFSSPVIPGYSPNGKGPGISNCVIVRVGDVKGYPDYTKCKSLTSKIGDGSGYSAYVPKILALAKTQLGKTYSLGACHGGAIKKYPTGCSSYDCSSFTQWAVYWGTDQKFLTKGQTCLDFGNCYAYYDGMRYYQFDSSMYTKFFASDYNLIQPGDLVYFGFYQGPNGQLVITHTGIFEGTLGSCGGALDCVIHAGKPVNEKSLQKIISSKRQFIGFLRPKMK